MAECSIRWMPLNLPFLSHRVVTIRERLKFPPGNVASQCASRARLEEIPGHSWGALQLFGRWKSPEGTLLRMKQHRATALFHLMNGCLKAEKEPLLSGVSDEGSSQVAVQYRAMQTCCPQNNSSIHRQRVIKVLSNRCFIWFLSICQSYSRVLGAKGPSLGRRRAAMSS